MTEMTLHFKEKQILYVGNGLTLRLTVKTFNTIPLGGGWGGFLLPRLIWYYNDR